MPPNTGDLDDGLGLAHIPHLAGILVARMNLMARVLLTFPLRIRDGGKSYAARACGRQRSDGMWEGWVEFVPDDGGTAVPSPRETTQPNLTDLEYWATGLTPVYLEGCLVRALTPLPRRTSAGPPGTPASTEPAPHSLQPRSRVRVSEPVLDPFAVYAKGEDRLRQQLQALSAPHLLAIIRAHRLAAGLAVDPEMLSEAELVAFIMSATRARAAA
jgi:hypothetical protein